MVVNARLERNASPIEPFASNPNMFLTDRKPGDVPNPGEFKPQPKHTIVKDERLLSNVKCVTPR